MKVYDPFCNLLGSWAQALGVIIVSIIYTKWDDWVSEELGAHRYQAILLAPVFLACGIGLYFSLMFEPFWGYGLVALGGSFLAVYISRGLRRVACVSLLLIALGFCAAQLRTVIVHTPILMKSYDFKDVTGDIERIETLDKGVRLTLNNVVIEGLKDVETPRKIRVKLWKGDGYAIGQSIKGLASLHPPSPPVIPQGFDFQHYMFYRGIGAVGFLYKPPEIVEQSGARYSLWIEGFRHKIGGRIEDALDAPQSGLARALMIGQRSSIADDDMEAIRAAGLAHMLAISGLHVGLFSGVIFFFSRLIMAMFPRFALSYPIKKYAAILAMIGAFFYMLIAGATIPTQRAMITVGIMFLAILMDRSPISLRVVAFAAFCVLLFFPESLLSASFQMSFAAVTGLVAFYEWTRPLWSGWSRKAGLVRKIALYIGGVAVTTVIATLVTAPLTLYHFQALPSYGLLANMICVPLLAFAVMPLAILAFLVMPFGVEGIALMLMEPVLGAILDFAHIVSGIEGAVLHIPSFSQAALVFFVLMALSLILLRAHLRIIFVVLCVVVLLLNFKWNQYDVLVSSKFDLVSLHPNDAKMLVSDKRKSRFMRDNWGQAMGLENKNVIRFPQDGSIEGDNYALRCDPNACRYEAEGHKLSYLKLFDYEMFRQECLWADIVISQGIYKKGHAQNCEDSYVINRGDGKYQGVHGFIFDEQGGIILKTTEDFRGNRPWVQRPASRYSKKSER